MSVSLYAATVTPFIQVLGTLAGLLDKAEAWCRERGLPDTALTEARLAADMWPLGKQVTAAVHHSAGAIRAVRSGEGAFDPSAPPTDFATLKALLAEALAALQAVAPDDIAAAADREVRFRVGERSLDFVAPGFLLSFAVPNFYFHATTTYAILRNQGLPVGKRDFLGALQLKPQPA